MRTSEKALPLGPTLQSSRRAELEQLEAQLAEWTALIGQYRANARRMEAQSRLELDSITDELQLRRNEANDQVMRLKVAADAEWEREKSQMERTWEAIRISFRKARARW